MLLAAALGWSRAGYAEDEVARFTRAVPRALAECDAARCAELREASVALERWAAELIWRQRDDAPVERLAALDTVLEAKARVDASLENVLALRGEFAREVKADQTRLTPDQQALLRRYLEATTGLADLSGRLRYTLADGVRTAERALRSHPAPHEALLRNLIRRKSSIGAAVLAGALLEQSDDAAPEPKSPPLSEMDKFRVLELVAAARRADALPQVAEFARRPGLPASLALYAASVIVHVGLPQAPRPPVPEDAPAPPILAPELREIVAAIDPAALNAVGRTQRLKLLEYLAERAKNGLVGESFRVGDFEVRSGDWLLMRSPSPYNMFTDMSPGLCTHVGVVTTETGPDGVRRFVIVDLPERGAHVPAQTVDSYLTETLHYYFLRHRDPAVASKIGDAARAVIGNETQFDLRFKIERVYDLAGKDLKGQRIHTYCAGFLLLCTLPTGLPKQEFFPVPETPAGGYCSENLGKLGLSLGEHFISPTGALFSPNLEIVGRREPMYSPEDEVKDHVYDYFALAMREKRLRRNPDAYQFLREKVAELSKFNPWLAKALAKAHNVSEHMDLDAAAKAAAVVETLDETGDGARFAFLDARDAITGSATDEELAAEGYEPDEIANVNSLRQTHAALHADWRAGKLTPRELRMKLVEFYKAEGRKNLNARFFPE